MSTSAACSKSSNPLFTPARKERNAAPTFISVAFVYVAWMPRDNEVARAVRRTQAPSVTKSRCMYPTPVWDLGEGNEKRAGLCAPCEPLLSECSSGSQPIDGRLV